METDINDPTSGRPMLFGESGKWWTENLSGERKPASDVPTIWIFEGHVLEWHPGRGTFDVCCGWDEIPISALSEF